MPDSNLVVVEKRQIIDMEALDLITRLKKIWMSLLILYIPEEEMPDIHAISEVDFILDQIEISIQIVSSYVDPNATQSYSPERAPQLDSKSADKSAKEAVLI